MYALRRFGIYIFLCMHIYSLYIIMAQHGRYILILLLNIVLTKCLLSCVLIIVLRNLSFMGSGYMH